MCALPTHALANESVPVKMSPDCRMTLQPGSDLARIAADRGPWDCSQATGDRTASTQALRFDLDSNGTEPRPRFLVSRNARFDRIVLAAIAADGTVVQETVEFAEINATFFDRQFALPLPDEIAQANTLLVEFEGMAQPIPVDYAHLRAVEPGSTESERNQLLLIALLCGMMLMPLIFDAAFYRVLREPFILWHAAFVVCIVWQLSATFGLYLPLFELSLPATRISQVGSFSAMVIAGVMFCASFIEEGKLDPRLRRALVVFSPCFAVVAVIHMSGLTSLGAWPARAFYYSGGIYGAMTVAALWQALSRGSTAARFLAIGLGPLMFVALLRVATFALPGMATVDANNLMLAATLVEAVTTAMGVTHRFMAIRDERDRTRQENASLEELAKRDPLTGLMNRRALMNSFEELVEQGYTACALIDVDRFKSINDEFGHTTGDSVLVKVAEALQPDDSTMVFRLGGEEFLILLRGPAGLERAERRRRAITARIMTGIRGLDRPVTASMGIVDFSVVATEGQVDFATIYSRADQLLYAAKETGRNRTEFEMLSFFEAPADFAEQKTA